MATGTAINFDAMCEQYVRTQLDGDRRAALQFIDAILQSGASADEVRMRVVQAAQREIGRLWQEDRISIAQEHMATAISQLALAHLFQRASFHARVGKKVLVSCVPGEHHDFPARLLADALDVAGYDVRFLGADVPLDALLRAIEGERPDMLALSATMVFNIPSLRSTVQAVRTRSKRPVPIAVGGNAFQGPARVLDGFGADLVAIDATDFMQQLERYFGART